MPELSEIVSQFTSLGIDLDDEAAATCLDLCLRYSLDEESFVNSWIAFSFSSLGGADPSKENLEAFEKKELANIKTPKRSSTASHLQVYSTGSAKQISVHSADSFTPPRPGTSGISHTSSKKLNFSPLVFTPEVYTPSEKFNGRKNSGQTVSTLGKSFYEWKSTAYDVNISMYNPTDTSGWKFFYDTVMVTSNHLEERFEFLADEIVAANNLEKPTPFKHCGLDVMTFRGRICPYDKAKKSKQLNSIEIQGMFESDYAVMELDVSEVDNFAIFPGQVIVFEGVLVGKNIRAKKLYSSAVQKVAPPPTIQKPVQILVAAGPFALSDTLSYEPLNELIDLVKKDQPNILVLVGPLVDATHPKIAQGQIAETFSDYYSRMVQRIGDALDGLKIKVVVIASSKDANNLPVFPTPPAVDHSYKNVKFFPDPSLLFIEGLVLGVTSVDALFHLGKHELSNCQTNRLARLAAHMVGQRSFYPLYPPEPEVCMDVVAWARQAQLSVTPHIMILPSDLHGFIKEVDSGCISLNPGKLTKGLVGGTYALIEVRPVHSDEEWKVSSHVSSKIVRI
ncbi:hypothetical protein GE061_005348 [Apolygus lucorum]|uniref:DNA polymerase alpha subunit B n=1 Tax=Apolygus lucorum TaxID=248454 RepID=A0A6A4J1Q5_APOLU|nr:hypothetical protein GE061_005348 [Apolygus lucorum]